MSTTVGTFLTALTARFSQAGIDNPRLDARILVGHVVGIDPSMLFARSDMAIDDDQYERIAAFAQRRLAHEPVARIVGAREFWSMSFDVTPDVLDPRADTETLVAAILALRPSFSGSVRILDLGTGTGCILLAILSAWPEATGTGIDISPNAVDVATKNAARLGFSNRTAFRQGNWCEGLTESFDIVVSNPPYISTEDFSHLQPDVKNFDLPTALKGGADGLDAYRALLPGARKALKSGGKIGLEFGAGQEKAVTELAQENSFRCAVEYRDLAGIVRCVIADADPEIPGKIVK